MRLTDIPILPYVNRTDRGTKAAAPELLRAACLRITAALSPGAAPRGTER